MAKTTITHITDDMDGSRDASEVSFSYGGVDYTIDLSKKNRAAFDKAVKPYIDAATKVPKGGSAARRPSSSSRASSGRNYAAIREWAKARGIEVSERGRVARSVIEQYDAAQ